MIQLLVCGYNFINRWYYNSWLLIQLSGMKFSRSRESKTLWGQHSTLPTTRRTIKQIFRNFDRVLGASQSPVRSFLMTKIQISTRKFVCSIHYLGQWPQLGLNKIYEWLERIAVRSILSNFQRTVECWDSIFGRTWSSDSKQSYAHRMLVRNPEPKLSDQRWIWF